MPMSLQEISDRLEIQDLLAAYSHAIDGRDWDALDDIFTALDEDTTKPVDNPVARVMRDGRAIVLTTTLDPAALEEQITERTVSRLVEMCGDPLMLCGTDRRIALPDPFPDEEPLPYGAPRARPLAS